MSDTGKLPFLVVHGGSLWIAVAPVFVAGVYGAWAGWRRWRMRRRARRVRAELGTPAHELRGAADESVHVVEGILRSDDERPRHRDGTPAACATFWSGRRKIDGSSTEEVVVRRAGALRVESERGAVELTGDVTVMVGSSERATSWRALQGGALERLREDAGTDEPPAAWKDRPVHRELEPGDRVLAYGRLVRTAGEGEAGYRDDGGALRMEAAEGAGSILLACAGAPKPGRPTWGRLATVLGAGLALFFASAYVLGHYAIKASKDMDYRMAPYGQPFALPAFDRLTLAAATPFHRDEALERIAREIHYGDTAEQARLDAAVALADLRGDCAGAASLLFHHNRYRAALERDAQCPEPSLGLQARAHAALAEFGAASDALHALEEAGQLQYRSPTDVAIHVLAHEWKRAAAMAHAKAASNRRSGDDVAGAGLWQCLALAFDAKAGDEDAVGVMRAATGPGTRAPCAVLAAELTGDARDVDAVAALEIGESTAGYALRGARDHLLLAHRPEQLDDESFLTLQSQATSTARILGDHSAPRLGELGLARRAAPRLAALATTRPRLAKAFWAQLTLGAAHAGLYDEAAGYTKAARANLTGEGSRWLLRRAELALRLRRPGERHTLSAQDRADLDPSALGGLVELIGGDVEPFIDGRLENDDYGTPYAPLAEGLRRAGASGNGEPLRGALRRDAYYEWYALPLLARYIHHGRGPLREFVQLAESPSSIEAAPWLGQVGMRLMLAESLADDELIATYRELARRHFEAVTDPELAMFLYLLSA